MHKQPYIPDGRPALFTSPSRFIQTQHWFHCEGEMSPTRSQEQAGGQAENTWNCNTKQDMQLCSSSGPSESMGQRYKTSFNLWIHRQTQTQLLQWRFVLLPPWRCMCRVCQFILSPQSQQCRSWFWLKALLQCRFTDIWSCTELPGQDSQVVFYLRLFFGCLLCWWWEREEEEVTAPFIQVFQIQSYVSRLTNWNNWIYCPLLCMDAANLAQSIGRTLGTLQLWNAKKTLEIIWFSKGRWQVFWIKKQ